MNHPFSKPEVEKIRKPQWTEENTRKTQAVIDEMKATREAVICVNGHNNGIVYALNRAIKRFLALDPGAKA